MAVGWGCAEQGSASDCPVGSLDCPCTTGSGCDPGLSCVEETCRVIDNGTSSATTDGSATGTSGETMSGSQSGSATTTGTPATSSPTEDTDASASATDSGPLLDVGSADTDIGPLSGCQAIDVLFVLDGSGSMIEERNALAAQGAFTQIIGTLQGLNGGGIDYRIGVTDDDDHGFLVPAGWAEPNPWFESVALDDAQMVAAFNGAVQQVSGLGGASVGCEHVLTSAVDLLDGDVSDFVREDALLVLVLLTDVDDYGAYDQQGGNICGIGCATAPTAVETLHQRLVDDVKAGQTDAVSAIVIAGDPALNGGLNLCEQPGSCGCDGIDCEIFHADRLLAFTDLLGTNGVFADLCSANVPNAVQTALDEDIDIACMNFEPAG